MAGAGMSPVCFVRDVPGSLLLPAPIAASKGNKKRRMLLLRLQLLQIG